MVGEEAAYKYRGIVYLCGSASAEVFADVALCPMEMIKVKVQTSVPGTFPTEFSAAFAKVRCLVFLFITPVPPLNTILTDCFYQLSADPSSKFPFGSVVPLWSRQIPYTMAKFFFFEKVVEAFYKNVFTAPKESYSKGTQLGITFASGYTAGVICAIVSHPADTVVSKMSKGGGKSAGAILSELGFAGIWGGLGTRIIMIGTLTGLQWWIYDTFKSAMGMGTSGGAPKKH